MSWNPLDTESCYLNKVTDELEESIIKTVKNKEGAGVSNKKTGKSTRGTL